MMIAGEPSGDTLAAELAQAMRRQADTEGLALDLFGAGGPRMAEAGVEVAFDMTAHAVVGVVEVLKHYGAFRHLFHQLLDLALARQPDIIVCVDFSGFNRRFAHALRLRVRQEGSNWRPRIVQYVSPQVWASRPSRAEKMARDIDLLLVIFPFEKDWYAQRVPSLKVEFVGHPMLDRYSQIPPLASPEDGTCGKEAPCVLLLPGSRVSELKRHLPVLLPALEQIRAARPELRFHMVLPDAKLVRLAQTFPLPAGLELQVGELASALSHASLALASTGTVTMECAYFGVPTVTLYRTSWLTYEVARRVVKVRSLTMPNLLAGENIYPEFLQEAATPTNLARAGLELLANGARRRQIRASLTRMLATLGGPGGSQRAARAVLDW